MIARVAQLAEQRILNPRVRGSNPLASTFGNTLQDASGGILRRFLLVRIRLPPVSENCKKRLFQVSLPCVYRARSRLFSQSLGVRSQRLTVLDQHLSTVKLSAFGGWVECFGIIIEELRERHRTLKSLLIVSGTDRRVASATRSTSASMGWSQLNETAYRKSRSNEG